MRRLSAGLDKNATVGANEMSIGDERGIGGARPMKECEGSERRAQMDKCFAGGAERANGRRRRERPQWRVRADEERPARSAGDSQIVAL